jgi:uncharacterized protein YndB with AHSA1/START domain
MQMGNDKMIRKEMIVNCSTDQVWRKWTTRKGLLTFFGFDNQIEFKIGGKYEIYFLMDNAYGLRGGEGCKILSYSPAKMLSFTWNAPPQYPEIRNHNHKTWVVLYFHPVDTKSTKVVIEHLGWLDGEMWDMVFQYFDKAWVTVLDRLDKSCQEKEN